MARQEQAYRDEIRAEEDLHQERKADRENDGKGEKKFNSPIDIKTKSAHTSRRNEGTQSK